MKTLLVFVVVAAIAIIAGVYFFPANAADAVMAATAAPAAAGIHIDFTPLIPVINGLIEMIGGILVAATPVFAGYIVLWLRNHGIQAGQRAQQAISERITSTIQNGLKYATSGADIGISQLNIKVDNPMIAKAANYAILQAPDLLKKAGVDVTTDEGQQTLIRRITAESMPTPPAMAPASTVNVTSDRPEQVGGAISDIAKK